MGSPAQLPPLARADPASSPSTLPAAPQAPPRLLLPPPLPPPISAAVGAQCWLKTAGILVPPVAQKTIMIMMSSR